MRLIQDTAQKDLVKVGMESRCQRYREIGDLVCPLFLLVFVGLVLRHLETTGDGWRQRSLFV